MPAGLYGRWMDRSGASRPEHEGHTDDHAMNRRKFLASSALAAPVAYQAAFGADASRAPQYYELREYHLLYGSKQRELHDFLGEIAVPAFNRAGIEPVGAFGVMYGPNDPSAYLLLPHPTLESVETFRRRLAEDDAYTSAGAEMLKRPMADPAYVRYESSLMKAFDEMPTLETPVESEGRIFELRVYESHTDEAALRKIEMFNNGEIPIFRDVGLHPVFFAETLIGDKLPNLTYMLVFESMAERDAAWARFIDHPDWKELSADPYYAETVSTITDFILRPTGYSQI